MLDEKKKIQDYYKEYNNMWESDVIEESKLNEKTVNRLAVQFNREIPYIKATLLNKEWKGYSDEEIR